MFNRYVAMGDSFTEGVGDDLPNGKVRGWADLVAFALAEANTEPVAYANLAVRGKLLGPILADQLEPALALGPDLLSVCGGGNDIMRPRVAISYVVDLLEQVVERALAQNVHVVMLAGANPSRHLPLGSLIQRRGDRLAEASRAAFVRPGVTFVDNWADTELEQRRYWSADKLHLNALGHTRVATHMLNELGAPVPHEWVAFGEAEAPSDERVDSTAAYYRAHVLPWIGRRLTGRSSGDGRPPKRPALERVDLGVG